MSSSLVSNNLVQIKDGPSYTAELEADVLLNPLARAGPSKDSFAFTGKMPASAPLDTANAGTLKALFQQAQNEGIAGVG